MKMTIFLLAFSLAAGLSFRLSKHQYLLDQANNRSMHSGAIPRSGGIALLVATAVSVLTLFAHTALSALQWLGMALLILLPPAFLDDHGHVPAGYRLLAQFAGAGLLVYGYAPDILQFADCTIIDSWIIPVFFTLFTVWLINLYNFMDGMDGLAAGMAVIGLGCLSVLGLKTGAVLYTGVTAITAAASAGFLLINLSPSRIFMGDLGSTLLGGLIAALLLWGVKSGVLMFSTGLLIFSPFIMDATTTLARRALNRERIWEAHNTHYYQRLARVLGRTQTLLLEYSLMLSCSVSAYWMHQSGLENNNFILLTWLALYALLMIKLERFLKIHTEP